MAPPAAGDAGSVVPQLADRLLARCTFPAPGGPLACAVSGGADSLALLVLAVRAGCRAVALHVDHGLRAGSREEAHLVERAASRLGAAFRSLAVSVPPGPNLEARARAARYAVLPPDVSTGHTMDDQAETVLCNLLRGAGPDGLGGMRQGARHPLLGLRRHETRAVCEEAGLEWAEDPTNEDPRHVRNRVRHELLPLCARVSGRDPVPLLARTALLSALDASYLDELAAESVPDPAAAGALAAAPRPLAARAVRRWLRELGATPATGGRAAPGGADRHPPSSAAVDRVLAVAAREAVATEIGGGWRVRRSRGRLVPSPPAAVRPPAPAAVRPPAPRGASVARRRAGTVPSVTSDPASAHAGTGAGTGSRRGGPSWASPDVGPVLITAEAIAEKVSELGRRITEDFAGDPPLLVGVLKGAMLFMSDLCRAIELPVDVDFMAVSSYGDATQSSGVVRILKDLEAELTGRRVLVVEDIIDSGLTLNYLRHYLEARSPRSVDVCALLVKGGLQRIELDLRYIGFEIPPEFVIGYGLDVAERYRNLTGIHTYRDGAGTPG